MTEKSPKHLVQQRKNGDQLCLPLGYDREALERHFSVTEGKPVALTITNNSSTLLSMKTKEGVLYIRLHRMFLHADGVVIDEITDFMRCRKGRTPHLRTFVRQNNGMLPKKPPRKTKLKAQGRCYDLDEIYRQLNSEYFEGKICCPITWSARSSRSAARKRTLGSYNGHTNIIRINPLLDRRTVPRYFIEFVVYHEMVHADAGMTEEKGRQLIHSKEFRRRERLFMHYARAVAWEKERGF